DGIRDPLVTGVQTCALPILTVTLWLKAAGRRVPLLAGPGALSELPRALAEVGFEGRLFVVADARAMLLHQDRLRAVLPDAPVLRSEERRVGKGVGDGESAGG